MDTIFKMKVSDIDDPGDRGRKESDRECMRECERVCEGGREGIRNTDLDITQIFQKCCEILRFFISFALAVSTKAEKLARCFLYPWT